MLPDALNLRHQIVACSINAAQRAVEEAHFDDYDEVGLNEAWIQSFVSIYLNDLLRERYSKDGLGVENGDVFSIIEKRASWIDRALGGRPDNRYDISGSRKFDICLWDDAKPFALIEIKHNDIALWGKQADLEKIVRSVLRWPQLSFSMFLFSARNPPEEVQRDISDPAAKLLTHLDDDLFDSYGLELRSASFSHEPHLYWHAITASRRANTKRRGR